LNDFCLINGCKKLFSRELLSVANSTCFFRDCFVWNTLKDEVLPQFVGDPKWFCVDESRYCKPVRVLVVGCSSGCEAYSVGILFSEFGLPVEIDAIDFDEERIIEARKGIYFGNELMNVSGKRLKKFL
jgi:two-component system, chemotaxis family, CheB/CheR fusion protein